MLRAIVIALVLTVPLFGSWLVRAPAKAQQIVDTGRTPIPRPPKGQGDHCVRDTDFMRRYHMTVLKQHRDETVHLGVRTKDFSLANCVTCHAVTGADGKPVSYTDPKHFCRSCHSYAAVSIDCFECHTSRPVPNEKSASAVPDDSDIVALMAYLREARP
jgi:predicted CXXCH cytochrome family protein